MNNSEINIVIVDDTEINILMLEKLLKIKRYSIKSFYSAEGVVEYLKDNSVNLVLLDIMMPNVDGFELCENIKSVEELKDIPIIFISAKNEEEDKVKGFQLGAVDYIEKPFKALELLSRVNTHIQNQISKEKLTKMNIEKDKFLSILSHDLRGPFTSILGNLELLRLEDIVSDNSKRVLELIKDITSSSKNFYRLLEDLLQWGLVQRGKIVVNKEDLQVLEIFEIVKMMYGHSFKNKDISLVIECEDSFTINADKFMIKEAIGNLVSNSIKFTNRGGNIVLKAYSLNSKKVISIEDNGVGMTQDQIDILFDLSSSNTTKGTEMEKGTGLGMILVDEFVSKNGGIIDIESSQGVGTVFKLVFNS